MEEEGEEEDEKHKDKKTIASKTKAEKIERAHQYSVREETKFCCRTNERREKNSLFCKLTKLIVIIAVKWN